MTTFISRGLEFVRESLAIVGELPALALIHRAFERIPVWGVIGLVLLGLVLAAACHFTARLRIVPHQQYKKQLEGSPSPVGADTTVILISPTISTGAAGDGATVVVNLIVNISIDKPQ